MRRVIIAIGLAMLVLGISPLAMADVDSNSIIKDGVEYYIKTDKTIYDLSENVNILYRVTNLTDETVSLGWVIDDPLAY
jgi:hypothetical protein